jgi:hypothetical protein
VIRLVEPDRHQGLSAPRWDEGAARRAIEAIVRDCEEQFSAQALWPWHPLDAEGSSPAAPCTMPYMGATGVISALDFLARRGMAEPADRFVPVLETMEGRNRAEIERSRSGLESYLMGRSGVLLARHRLRPSPDVAERLAGSIAVNREHRSHELMWGAPGTMHAALAMHESTHEERWAELFRSSAAALEAVLIEGPEGCRLWQQDLYDQHSTYLGAGHGFAGSAGAIVRGMPLLPPNERERWSGRIVRTTLATVVRDGALANWPGWTGGRKLFLVQWCHGAPGFITSLAALRDNRLDEVLLAAGELIWTAGPLAKGAGLCHGTAGNGFAFLKLFERTGEERWLERARAFAMHAIEQSEAHAASYGMRRYSLYTGDPGLAIYLARCIEGAAGWPGLDPE